MMNKISVSAILCAAGTSARMGDNNKLLLPFNDKSIIHHCVSYLLASEIDELIVVLGHEYDALMEELHPFLDRIKIVNNDDYLSGHTSSIRCGVRVMNDNHSSFLIGLGDMPLITSSHYNQIIRFYKEKVLQDCDTLVRPIYHDIPGHPVIMSSNHKEAVLSCKDHDGCRSVIKNNMKHLSLMMTEEKCYIQDTDTPESYNCLITTNL